MENFDRKKHWENIYQTKKLKDVSWFQPTPETSLDFKWIVADAATFKTTEKYDFWHDRAAISLFNR